MKLKAILSALALIVTVSACIKEDRSNCPCYLHLDLSRVDSHYVHTLDLMMEESISGRSPEWIPVEKSYLGDTLIMPVNKSEFDLCAWGNLGSSMLDQNARSISPLIPRDSLWSSFRHIVTRCEDAYVQILPERQYIPVTIIIRGITANISAIQPALSGISANLDFAGRARGPEGIQLPERISAPEQENNYYLYKTMIMTQPRAEGLHLDLKFIRDGESLRSEYPLGEMLMAMGEDISKTDQKPVLVDIAIGSTSIQFTLKVEDWTTHGVYAITY